MTPKELLEGLKVLMQELIWEGETKIFGHNNVHIVPIFPLQQIAQYVLPCCFIADSGNVSHFQHEGIIEQRINLYFVVKNYADNRGGQVYQGANRVANTSFGAGSADIESKILEFVRDAISMSEMKIVMRSNQRYPLLVVKRNAPMSVRRIVIDARTYLY